MKSVAIVEPFHPIDDIDSRVISGGIGLSVHAFDFERLEEAFSHRVIPRGQASRSQQFALRLIDAVMP
jgi:hypothetical protein